MKNIRKTKKYKELFAIASGIADQMRFKLGLGHWTMYYISCTLKYNYFRAEVDFFTSTDFNILRLEFSTVDEGKTWMCGGQTHVTKLSDIQVILDAIVANTKI